MIFADLDWLEKVAPQLRLRNSYFGSRPPGNYVERPRLKRILRQIPKDKYYHASEDTDVDEDIEE